MIIRLGFLIAGFGIGLLFGFIGGVALGVWISKDD